MCGLVYSSLNKDLLFWIVLVKFVMKLLMLEWKQICLEVLQDILNSPNSNLDFLNIVVTDDESWVYGYDPKIRA